MTTQSRELAVRSISDSSIATTRSPHEIVSIAQERASVLMQIVNEKKLFTMIGEKKHLDAEAWQIICAFDNADLVPEWTQPILDNDHEIIGYKARVNLMQHGEIIGAGEMSCGFEEFPCRGKEGMAKHRAAMSAAQTWAGAKAGRTKYAWVAVLAGYAPTPAEEMKQDEPDKTAHYCQKHEVNWFMRGKMRNYAHPVVDTSGGKTGEWCNEPTLEKSSKPPRPAAQPLQPNSPAPGSWSASGAVSPEEEKRAFEFVANGFKQFNYDPEQRKSFLRNVAGNENGSNTWASMTPRAHVEAAKAMQALLAAPATPGAPNTAAGR